LYTRLVERHTFTIIIILYFEELQFVDQGMLMFKLCNNNIIKYVLTNDNFFFSFLKELVSQQDDDHNIISLS